MSSKDALRFRILELCEQNHLTLNGLCYRSGVTQSTMFNLIGGRNRTLNVATVQKLCDGLGIDLPTFFQSELFLDLEPEPTRTIQMRKRNK